MNETNFEDTHNRAYIGRLQDKGILPFSGGVIVSSFAPLPALFWLSGTHMKEKKSD